MSEVHAIRVHRHGGPDELRYEAVEVGRPKYQPAAIGRLAQTLGPTDHKL